MIELPVDLRAALTTLMREDLEGLTGTIGDKVLAETGFEGNVWLHPRVLAFKRAVEIVSKYAGV